MELRMAWTNPVVTLNAGIHHNRNKPSGLMDIELGIGAGIMRVASSVAHSAGIHQG